MAICEELEWIKLLHADKRNWTGPTYRSCAGLDAFVEGATIKP